MNRPAAIGREVDLVVLNAAPPLRGRRIVRGVRVHCASPELDHAFQRDVQLRAADLEPFIQAPPPAGVRGAMTVLVERLGDLQRQCSLRC